MTLGGYRFRIHRFRTAGLPHLELTIEPAMSDRRPFAGATIVQVWLGPVFFPFVWVPLFLSILVGLTAASFGDFARQLQLK